MTNNKQRHMQKQFNHYNKHKAWHTTNTIAQHYNHIHKQKLQQQPKQKQ